MHRLINLRKYGRSFSQDRVGARNRAGLETVVQRNIDVRPMHHYPAQLTSVRDEHAFNISLKNINWQLSLVTQNIFTNTKQPTVICIPPPKFMGELLTTICKGRFFTDAHNLPSQSLSSGDENLWSMATNKGRNNIWVTVCQSVDSVWYTVLTTKAMCVERTITVRSYKHFCSGRSIFASRNFAKAPQIQKNSSVCHFEDHNNTFYVNHTFTLRTSHINQNTNGASA